MKKKKKITMRKKNKPLSASEWDKHVHHPLQSYGWGEFRKKMGLTIVRTHTWQITFHKIPHTPWTVGYFPKGPKPTKDMCKELLEIGRQKNAIFIQLEPESTVFSQLSARTMGLTSSHHPLFTKYTFVLDLTKTEDELLSSMHSKTRYNIRLAQRKGVVIRKETSDKAFEEYLRLTRETVKRQGFYAHNEIYHHTMWHIMKQSGIATLWTATYEGHVLAAWIIFAFKDTIYYPYGASGRKHRETMAPNLLLWEIAKWGKQNGYKKFDLWGALGPDPDTNDPWYGFHRFKEGYKPNLVEYTGSYDLIIRPFLYRLYCILDSVRWFILKKVL